LDLPDITADFETRSGTDDRIEQAQNLPSLLNSAIQSNGFHKGQKIFLNELLDG
jgi:hypothetical protein